MTTSACPATAAPLLPRDIAVSGAVPGLRVVRIGRNALLDGRHDRAWQALVDCASEPNPFFEPWYLRPSLHELDPREQVQVLVAERDGHWLGMLPLIRSQRYYGRPIPQWRNWVHANAFLGAPLVARGYEAAFWQALLTHVDRHAGLGLFLHLAGLPLDGPLHLALTVTCARQQRRMGLVHREVRALLASDLGPEAYLDRAMTGKKRKELRRQFARLSEQGSLTVHRQRDTADIARWTRDFLALEQAGWKGAAGSALASAPETARLFTQAMAAGAANGRIERLTLALDDQPLAMLATFLSPPGAFSFKTAFDERFARFSPGVLLQRENLALLDDPALDWCDSCAAEDHPMIDHIWRERRAVGRLSIAIGGPIRRALFAPLLGAEQRRSKAAAAAAPTLSDPGRHPVDGATT